MAGNPYLFTFLLLSLAAFFSAKGQTQSRPADTVKIRVMTYNLSGDHRADEAKGNGWNTRKMVIRNLFNYHRPDVMGLQEVNKHQALFIAHELKDYGWVGVGRDNGEDKGEMTPIFYNKAIVELVSTGHFWLSQTPNQPSRGWDATQKRMVTWAKFKELSTKREFFYFNAQFAKKGTIAPFENVRLLKSKVVEIAGNGTVIIGGDFHFGEDDEPYKELVGVVKPPDRKQSNFTLLDAFAHSKTQPQGPAGTTPGYYFTELTGKRMDIILTNPTVRVLSHSILPDCNNGRYPSTHLPVLVELEF